MTTALITPVYNSYKPQWFYSIAGFLKSNDFEIITPHGGSNITMFRNSCLQQMLIFEQAHNMRFKNILWIDSDIVFTSSDVFKIISHNMSVVSGVYFEKGIPFLPVVGFYNIHEIMKGFPRISKEQLLSKSLIPIDWSGLGFLFHSREILDRLEYPWFEQRIVKLPEKKVVNGGFTIEKELLSEDITFCTKLREIGLKIYCDTSIILKHNGEANFGLEHYLACHLI
jgi:hypothetical protein